MYKDVKRMGKIDSDSMDLKIVDIDSKRKLIYIPSSMGKKDRTTILSTELLNIYSPWFGCYYSARKVIYYILLNNIFLDSLFDNTLSCQKFNGFQ